MALREGAGNLQVQNFEWAKKKKKKKPEQAASFVFDGDLSSRQVTTTGPRGSRTDRLLSDGWGNRGQGQASGSLCALWAGFLEEGAGVGGRLLLGP